MKNSEVVNDNTLSYGPAWYLGCAAITALSVLMRFVWLGLKPLHHDEGVNGFFLTTLFREGSYKYDPANYHGPTLYYVSLAFTKLFGLETIPIRASVAIFGVLTVVLAFFLRRYIGAVGSLAAALFLALSPGMVYISRYFIHEIIFVFLSLALVLAVLNFFDRREAGWSAVGWLFVILLFCFLPSTLNLAAAAAGENMYVLWGVRALLFAVVCMLAVLIVRMLLAWDNGRPIYLILAAACVSLLFATKETAFITLGTMLIAVVCVWIWRKFRRSRGEIGGDDLSGEDLTWSNFRRKLGAGPDVLLITAACFFTFIYIAVLFFSSFFTYAGGLWGAIEAYVIWTGTGRDQHTQNGMLAYLKWGLRVEAPIFVLSAIGTVVALLKARHRFAMFAGLWAFGLLAAYTIIPYKTPWLALSFILPMCIAAGYSMNELVKSDFPAVKFGGIVIGAAAVVTLAYQSYDLNFRRYDDNDMPYVYAHTTREFLGLVEKIEYYADKSGEGKEVRIDIISPDYWPMPWYFNDYKHANFHGGPADTKDSDLVVTKLESDTNTEQIARFSAFFRFHGPFPLRPGVDLLLLVRKDLADGDAKELYKIQDIYQ